MTGRGDDIERADAYTRDRTQTEVMRVKATRSVRSRAVDEEDARLLLDVLGLETA